MQKSLMTFNANIRKLNQCSLMKLYSNILYFKQPIPKSDEITGKYLNNKATISDEILCKYLEIQVISLMKLIKIFENSSS